MKKIVKSRPVIKPQAYPQRYVEDFEAKYGFARASSLKGCGAIGRMLRISVKGKTARVLPLTETLASPPMASATARFMAIAIGSKVCGYHRPIKNWNKGKQDECQERKPYDVKSLMKGFVSGKMVNLRTSQKGA